MPKYTKGFPGSQIDAPELYSILNVTPSVALNIEVPAATVVSGVNVNWPPPGGITTEKI